jgi:acyl carrier protein
MTGVPCRAVARRESCGGRAGPANSGEPMPGLRLSATLRAERWGIALSDAEREAKVREIVANVVELDESSLTRTGLLVEEHGADSLDAIEILTHLETTFSVEIDPKAASRMVNVDAILEVLDEYGAK